MASSRWKRFAFFEKNALSLSSEVLEDLIPVGESSSSSKGTSGSRSTRRSSDDAPSNDRVNMVVTTAALPLDSKPGGAPDGIQNSSGTTNGDYAVALNEMWSSATACHPMDTFPSPHSGAASGDRSIYLPSQAQAFEDDRNVVSSGTAVDGLVLAFVTSCDTDRVHCFDISVRCNNKINEGSRSTTANNNDPSSGANNGTSGALGRKRDDLEDLDGWRGYLAPMKRNGQEALANSNDTGAGTGTSGGTSEKSKEGIIGIATCRASSGHNPIHMACITATNLVVCVDPHLYLSWYVIIPRFVDDLVLKVFAPGLIILFDSNTVYLCFLLSPLAAEIPVAVPFPHPNTARHHPSTLNRIGTSRAMEN